MAASSVPKLYRAVIEDVLNNVREAFLDEGVDEQVLMDLKQLWEKKINETKAVDNNARDPEPVPITKQSNRSNANSSHARNAQTNKEHTPAVQPPPPPPQQTAPPAVTPVTTPHIQSTVNHQVSSGLPQMHLQSGGNVVLGPSGINYTTSAEAHSEPQRTIPAPNPNAPKLVVLQGPNGQQHTVLVNSNGPLNITPELFNQLANFQSNPNIMNQNQATVVQHTSNLNPTIQYASAAQINARPPAPQSGPSIQNQTNRVVQLDGAHDTSDEDDDEDEYRDNDDDHEDNDDEINDEDNDGQGEDEEPLNSEDDVSDEDPTELFETDNVVVCQYDKITRSRNKWKFHLKDGIMNLQGKDYVFQKAVGDAEW